MLERIADGRTDLVFDCLAQGTPATTKTADGSSLLQWCAYYGDVSAIRFLLANGETLKSLGEDFGLNAAAFHEHWRLCQFLLEQGADANSLEPGTGETPLHAALSSTRQAQPLVVKVLLEAGADPQSQNDSLRRNRSLHARLPHQGRDPTAPRRRLRQPGNNPTSARRRRENRRQRRERRLAPRLGQLASPARCGSAKTLLREVFHSSRPPLHGNLSPRQAAPLAASGAAGTRTRGGQPRVSTGRSPPATPMPLRAPLRHTTMCPQRNSSLH